MIDKKKSATKKVKETTAAETQPEITQPLEEVTPVPTPTPETKVEPPLTSQPSSKPKPLTMANLKAEVDELHKRFLDLTMQMADIKIQLAFKRKPVANKGKCRIRDKQTGLIYKSKNNTYQSLLKSGELKELVDM